MKSLIGKLILWLGGRWKVVNNLPADMKKAVLVAAPHTSNWDFVYGLAALWVLGSKMKYLIKKEVWIFPFSLFLKWSGGIPVDRSAPHELTRDLINMLERSDELFLLFPPEGTRSRVKKWKTGFYHVAMDTKLPIVMGFMDFSTRECGYGDWFKPTGNKVEDFTRLENNYKDMKGKHPELYNPVIFEREV